MSDLNSTALHEKIVELGFTDDDEKSLIATNLHVSMLQALLMGIYTVVFAGTIYVYLTKQRSRRYTVPIAVSLLYIINLATLSLQWYSAKLQFINSGATRDTIFAAIVDIQVKLSAPIFIFNALSLVLSDGLLIWRCFNLWNYSVSVIAIPVFLTIAEGGELIVPQSNASLQAIFNKVSAAGIVISACTTIITTSLITYRIHSFLRNQEITSKKFRHIIDVIVQSGAVYSASVLVYGVSAALIGQNGMPTVILSFWTDTFVFPIAGISTTIMVARVAMLPENSNAPSSDHLTGIQFRPQSTTRTGTGTGARVSVVLRAHDDDASRDILEFEGDRAQVPITSENETQEV
ncbi:hypothetical protein BDN70DRAFT_991526 [Pholiota conissans]|uniref:Uncharacterized protein n=1 Tax=Pholiota conissans TaxID=109636 RepID=A0A9P5Z6U3_9AGAR|nr:hypothetical protein BDN70DRAFT_991526 [Pholiota conissans]